MPPAAPQKKECLRSEAHDVPRKFAIQWMVDVAKGDTRFPAERRYTQWRRNLNYKRNIIEGKRDNKNVLLPKRR